MKLRLLLAVLLSMLVVPPLAAAHEGPEPAPPHRAATMQSVIYGRVWVDDNDNQQFDAGEQPLPNVEVRLSKDDEPFGETLTDGQGQFQFADLEPGSYVVTMIDDTLPEEYRHGQDEVFTQVIPDDDQSYEVEKNFRLTPDLIGVELLVFGEVLDDQQQPLSGVTVQITHPDGEVLTTTITDTQGGYAFPPDELDAADWMVSVISPPGYTPSTPEQVPITLSFENSEVSVDFGFVSGDTTTTPTTPPETPTPPTTLPETTTPTDTTQVAEPPEETSPWLYIVPLLILLGVGAYLFLRARKPPAKPTVAPINFLQEFLKFRDEQAWSKMYELLEKMPATLAQSPLVRQQHAFALNRDGHGDKAEGFLKMLLEKVGPSTETNGILGRVYKDRWKKARDAGQTEQAAEHLEEALKIYLDGHAADPANPYPGLNALTLMEFSNPPPDQREALLKEVTAAVQARPQDNPYWDHATRLELAVLASNESEARAALADAVAAMRVVWEIETTLNNLGLIRSAREERGAAIPGWVGEVEAGLRRAMDGS